MSDREVFSTVDAALRAFSWWPEENRGKIHETIADLDIRLIYTPPGRSYIGLVIEGADTIVSLHSGFIAGLRDESGKKYWIELPVNRIHDGGYTQNGEPEIDPCPECGILLPKSGLCGNCY